MAPLKPLSPVVPQTGHYKRWLFALLTVVLSSALFGCSEDVGASSPVRTAPVEFKGEVTKDLSDNVTTVVVVEIEEGNAVALRQLLDCDKVKVDVSFADLEGGLPRDGDRIKVDGRLVLDSCTVNADEVEIKGR